MSRAIHIVTAGGAVLPVDTSPVSVEPPRERVFPFVRSPTGADALWLGAIGGSCTVELWAKDGADWFAATALPVVVPANRLALGFAGLIVPQELLYFVQITANAGATQLRVGTIYR